jgi:hypothetical protein
MKRGQRNIKKICNTLFIINYSICEAVQEISAFKYKFMFDLSHVITLRFQNLYKKSN